MRFPRTHKAFRGQLDVAAFAGVFFLLALLLAFSGSLVFTPGVPIHLPESTALPGTTNETVVVAVDAKGQVYFDNQISSESQLQTQFRAAVAAAKGPVTLIVQVDKETQFGVVQRLGLLARESGIHEMWQATRPVVAPRQTEALP